MKPSFHRIDCIRVYVPDLEAGYRFYHDQLGLPLVWKTEKGMGFLMGDAVTELVIQNEDPYQETDVKVDSVDETVRVMQNSGAKIVKHPFDIPIGRCAVVDDPWGNRIVILDTTKGTFITDSEGNVTGHNRPG